MLKRLKRAWQAHVLFKSRIPFELWQRAVNFSPTISRLTDTEQLRLRILAGESWRRGPVVLSWEDANPRTPHHSPGANVILHEFAHKLDMLNGSADGFPPLHKGMPIADWTRVLTAAFETLNHKLARRHKTLINPYAATNPAEFFAVLTEVFFEQPTRLLEMYPDLYGQLRAYYRQDPAVRYFEREGS